MTDWLSIAADIIIIGAFLVATRNAYRGLKVEAILKQRIAEAGKDEPRH